MNRFAFAVIAIAAIFYVPLAFPSFASPLSASAPAAAGNAFRFPDGLNNIEFKSKVTGQPDRSLYLAPAGLEKNKPVSLIVYHHGMNGFPLEALANCPDNSIAERCVKLAPSVFLSLSAGGKAGWGSDAAVQDITENIRALLKKFKVEKIVLMGTSMGASVVLNYAATAPDDVRNLITGVAAVEPASDMAKLYRTSDDKSVKDGIAAALGGTPDAVPAVYARKSPIANLGKLNRKTRVAIVYSTGDRIVPTPLQIELLSALKKAGFETHEQVMKGGHGIPPLDTYLNAVRFVLTR